MLVSMYLAEGHIFWAEWYMLYIFEASDCLLVDYFILGFGSVSEVVDGDLLALLIGVIEDLFDLVLHNYYKRTITIFICLSFSIKFQNV